MKTWLRIALVLVALAGGALPARAQEEQVPVDTAGRVMEIDRALAVRIGGLVDRYPELQVARLFRAPDSSHVLELTLRRDERTLRQREPMTQEQVDSLRARVSAAIAVQPVYVEVDQDGRTMLIAGASALGVGFYGWAVPVVLGLDGTAALAGYMFTTAASIVVPYLYTEDRPVTYGMANAWWWGATRGIVHASEFMGLVADEPSGDAMALATLAGSVGEGVAGYMWAERTGMSAGTAHTIGVSGDLGQAAAGTVLMMTLPEGGRVVLGGLLAGGIGGLVAGTEYASRRDHTWGDAEVLRAVTAVGAADGIALWDLVTESDDEDTSVRILGAAILAGSAAGFLYADHHLRGLDFSVGQSIIIDLAGIAGYSLGAGIAVLVTDNAGFDVESEEASFNSEIYTSLGALGATAGVLLGMHSLADDARRQDRERWDQGRLQFQLNPFALAELAPGVARATDRVRPSGPVAPPVPLLSVSYSF